MGWGGGWGGFSRILNREKQLFTFVEGFAGSAYTVASWRQI